MSVAKKPPASCNDPPRSDGREADQRGDLVWPLSSGSFVEDDDGANILEITVGFIDDRDGRRMAVLDSIKKGEQRPPNRETWEDWANIRFTEVTGDKARKADIRVGFDEPRPWSYVGQEANEYQGKSVSLGNIDPQSPPNERDFGFILHEFGHALGLDHEHQSPNRDSRIPGIIQNNLSEYQRSFGSYEGVESQMLTQLGGDLVMGATDFDPKSVMMYKIHGIADKPNNELSKLDKAFIMLLYPPDLTEDYKKSKEREGRLMGAMKDLHLTQTLMADILETFRSPGKKSERLEAVRQCFISGSSKNLNHQSKKNVSYSISPKKFGFVSPTLTKRFGVTDPLGDVVSDKLFRCLVKHTTRNALAQHEIPMEPIPGASPPVVAKMMAAICTDQQIAHYARTYKNQLQGSELDVFQQVFTLSFASGLVNDVTGDQKKLQRTLRRLLSVLLPTIDTNWRLEWGPAVWKKDPQNTKTGPENSWYIAFHPRLQFEDGSVRPTYVIAIAGTPQTSLHVWLNQNLAIHTVADFRAWVDDGIKNHPLKVAHGGINKDKAYIAMGTVKAVHSLLTIEAPEGAKAAGTTLLQFIDSLDKSASPVFITTGHSLGGALSPSLALALVLAGHIPMDNTLTYPFAGPSPGNIKFSELFAQTFPARKSRGATSYQGWNLNLVNTLDVVPQAWSTSRDESKQNLHNIPTIYGRSELEVVSWFAAFAKGLSKASGISYKPLPSQYFTGPTPSATPTTLKEFIRILVQQHTQAYLDNVGIKAKYLRSGLREQTEDEILASYPRIAGLKTPEDAVAKVIEETENTDV